MNAAPTKFHRLANGLLFAAGVIGSLAVTLLYVGPDEAGRIGFGLIAPAVALALIGISIRPVAGGSPVTWGEKRSWISLGVTFAAGVYLLTKLYSLGWTLEARDSGHLVGHVILLWTVAAVLLNIIRRREVGTSVEDERDRLIRGRALITGYRTLSFLMVVFAAAVGFSLVEGLPLSSRVGLASAIIGILLIAELARFAKEIWIYRQDRL